jgi:predicted transcriptional regulator
VGLKFNGTHRLLVYADYVNQLQDNINTIKKNTDTLIDVNKEVGLDVNIKKTKYMLLSYNQNARQIHDIKTFNISFKNVANRNLIKEKIKKRLNSGNACYHSVQSFCLLICCLET